MKKEGSCTVMSAQQINGKEASGVVLCEHLELRDARFCDRVHERNGDLTIGCKKPEREHIYLQKLCSKLGESKTDLCQKSSELCEVF